MDVAVDSTLWLSVSEGFGYTVSLNDIPQATEALDPLVAPWNCVMRGRLVRVLSGELEPNREHVLRVQYSPPMRNDAGAKLPFPVLKEPLTLEIRFRTATTRKALAERPAIDGVRTLNSDFSRSLSPLCTAVLRSQGCFDLGEPFRFAFDVEPSRAVAWLLQGSHLWPASCGSPALYTYYKGLGAAQGEAAGCVDVRAITAGGSISEPTDVCVKTSRDGGLVASVEVPAVSEAAELPSSAACPAAPHALHPGAAVQQTSFPDAAADPATGSEGCALTPHSNAARPTLQSAAFVVLALCRRRRARV